MEDFGRKRKNRSSSSSGASPSGMIRPPQPRFSSPVDSPSNIITNANQTLYGPPPPTPQSPNVFVNNYTYSPNRVQTPFQSNRPVAYHIPATQPTVTQPMPSETNTDMNKNTDIISDIYAQLRKLDSLPDIFNQLRLMNDQLVNLAADVQNMKHILDEHNERIKCTENGNLELNQRLAIVELERNELFDENTYLRESVLKLQSQSMKENLIISGLPEERYENTETVVKSLFEEKLQISNEIEFQAVHRLKHKPGGGHRSIVVRFEKRRDKNRILKAAPKLKVQNVHIYEQFPAEISDRRKKLHPKMRELRDSGYFTELRYDKLFVNGRIFDPTRTYEPVEDRRDFDNRRSRIIFRVENHTQRRQDQQHEDVEDHPTNEMGYA